MGSSVEQLKDVPCQECMGGGWSRSASGRCTPCRGTGMLHQAPPDAKGYRVLHAGLRAECTECTSATCAATVGVSR